MNLHLGCGTRFLFGYKHIDLAEYNHIDYKAPVYPLKQFQDNSVNIIYSSHTLEYFDRQEVDAVLTEWKRVLVPGGILRLAVPDFDSLLRVYYETKSLTSILGPLFGRWVIGNTDKVIYHKTVYNEGDLTNILMKLGFVNIQKWDWNKVFVDGNANYDDYSKAYFPHMDFDGIHISLNIEATKK